MKRHPSGHRKADCTSPTSLKLLKNPLEFLSEDHLRLRCMCTEMDHLADAVSVDQSVLRALTQYLTHELPLLLADEDEDLMPRVLRRAKPEDELPRLARRLAEEHAQISQHLATVMTGLKRLRPKQVLHQDLARALRDLAHATRRHLILENAVLMPLSRARLTNQDLTDLRCAMLARRGLQDMFSHPPSDQPKNGAR